MGGEQAAGVLSGYAVMPGQKGRLFRIRKLRRFRPILSNLPNSLIPFVLLPDLLDDGIIDPRKTRAVLGITGRSRSRPIQRTHFPVFRFRQNSWQREKKKDNDQNHKYQALLIANRGEIMPYLDTAQKMGCTQLLSIPNKARHVRLADEAIFIGAEMRLFLSEPRHPSSGYARQRGEDALSGYGFLSENPDFADAVRKAGFIFIGPPTKAIRAMGRKDEAKRLMADAGVPVVPGYDGQTKIRIL